MLGKLLKYDFRSMWKQFSFVWPAALALGIINRFTLPITDSPVPGDWGAAREWMALISMTVFIGICLAMVVVTAVYVLTRFYRGLMGDEGYLMHTLPVKTWQLVLSKLLCALVTTAANMVVGLLAIFLMMPVGLRDILDLELWQMIFRGILEKPGAVLEAALYLAEFFLLMLSMFALMFTMFYLSMAIGHLFSRRRVLMSVVAFFGLDILGNMLLSLLARVDTISHWVNWITFQSTHSSFWVGIGALLVPTVLMFLATSYILKNRLNLE